MKKSRASAAFLILALSSLAALGSTPQAAQPEPPGPPIPPAEDNGDDNGQEDNGDDNSGNGDALCPGLDNGKGRKNGIHKLCGI